jgi:hypothetical protein
MLISKKIADGVFNPGFKQSKCSSPPPLAGRKKAGQGLVYAHAKTVKKVFIKFGLSCAKNLLPSHEYFTEAGYHSRSSFAV